MLVIINSGMWTAAESFYSPSAFQWLRCGDESKAGIVPSPETVGLDVAVLGAGRVWVLDPLTVFSRKKLLPPATPSEHVLSAGPRQSALRGVQVCSALQSLHSTWASWRRQVRLGERQRREALRDARERHGPERQRSLVGPDRHGDGDEQQPAQVALHDLPQRDARQVCKGSKARWCYQALGLPTSLCLHCVCMRHPFPARNHERFKGCCRIPWLPVPSHACRYGIVQEPSAPASETGPSAEGAAAHLLERDQLLCGAESGTGCAVRHEHWSALCATNRNIKLATRTIVYTFKRESELAPEHKP